MSCARYKRRTFAGVMDRVRADHAAFIDDLAACSTASVAGEADQSAASV